MSKNSTLADWLRLKEARSRLESAQQEYESLAIDIMTRHAEGEPIRAAAADIAFGRRDFSTYELNPQSEWMGGPTSGPGSENTKTHLREPHAAGTFTRHFTAAEIREAKQLGLLSGDYSGPES